MLKSKVIILTSGLFSLLFIFSGVIGISFTVLIYPSLILGYGAGERFYLESYNNYTTQFPFSTNTRLHITITSNNSIQIYRDGIYVYNGTHYDIIIEPHSYALITVKSDSSVNGKLAMFQEPSWELQVGSILLILVGFVMASFSIIFWIKTRNKH